MNKELFLKVADAIENDPSSYDQKIYAEDLLDQTGEVCGTTMCIAGWALFLSRGFSVAQIKETYPEYEAAKELAITEDQGENLFRAYDFTNSWPEPYGRQMELLASSDDRESKAKLVASMLRAIANGEAILTIANGEAILTGEDDYQDDCDYDYNYDYE